MDKKIMWCLLIALWIFYISAVIVGHFSTIAYWVLLGLWFVVCVAIVVVLIIELRKLNKQKKKLDKQLEEIILGLDALDNLGMDNMDNLEVMATKWYNKLGIIKAKDKITNEIKIYIGEGWGFDEKQDIQHILAWGTKYTTEDFKELIKWLEVDNADKT